MIIKPTITEIELYEILKLGGLLLKENNKIILVFNHRTIADIPFSVFELAKRRDAVMKIIQDGISMWTYNPAYSDTKSYARLKNKASRQAAAFKKIQDAAVAQDKAIRKHLNARRLKEAARLRSLNTEHKLSALDFEKPRKK